MDVVDVVVADDAVVDAQTSMMNDDHFHAQEKDKMMQTMAHLPSSSKKKKKAVVEEEEESLKVAWT